MSHEMIWNHGECQSNAICGFALNHSHYSLDRTRAIGPSVVNETNKYTPASPFQCYTINRTEHNHKSCNYTHSHHQMDVLSKRNRYGLVSPAADEPIVEPVSVSVCMNEFKLNLIKYACVCLLNFIWSFDVTSDVVMRQVTPQHTHTFRYNFTFTFG